jgi:hypothetical protein
MVLIYGSANLCVCLCTNICCRVMGKKAVCGDRCDRRNDESDIFCPIVCNFLVLISATLPVLGSAISRNEHLL